MANTIDPKMLLAPKTTHQTANFARHGGEASRGTGGVDPKLNFTPTTVSSSNAVTPDGNHGTLGDQDSYTTTGPNRNGPGFSYFENLTKNHNVEDRRETAQKRATPTQAQEDEETAFVKKRKGNEPHGSGAILGKAVKDAQQEAAKKQPSSSIDLTGDNDDDVVFVSEKSAMDKEVCLGKIDHARVNAHRIPSSKTAAFSTTQKVWPVMRISLCRRPGSNTHIIGVSDPLGKDFGTIDVRTASVLAPLMDTAKTNHVRILAQLEPRKREPFEYPGQSCSKHLGVRINIYAPRRLASGIGKLFSQKNIFLSQPVSSTPGVDYVNPHEPKDFTPAKRMAVSTSRYGASGGQVMRTQEEVRQDVYRIFDTIQETDDLPEMEAPSKVKTPLLKHQKQALWFMTDREKEKRLEDDETSMWQRQDGGWFHVMTGHSTHEEPQRTLGGILADVMGLGKTLNILSLIVSSLEQAKAFTRLEPPKPMFESDPQDLVFNSRATLLVCPLSTVANWEEQIKQHLQGGAKPALRVFIYHGSDRPEDPRELEDYDVVITTYPIVTADFMKRSSKRTRNPLAAIHWFRVVLDEAHLIREQSTGQSKAVCALAAERRWAVTGTPVQNRLDDLGALFKFLRVRPFEEPKNFAQFIIAPFKMADVEILPRLRLLVDSVTLRRLKDKIDLPARTEQVRKLDMSTEERSFYDFFSRESQKGVNQMLKQDKIVGRGYAQVLKAILRMRLMCAGGSDLLSDEDFDLARGFDANIPIDLEEIEEKQPDRSPQQAYELYKMMKDTANNSCARCQAWITAREFKQDDSDAEASEDSDSEDEEADTPETVGYLAGCNQLICRNCIDQFAAECAAQASQDNWGPCPICESYMPMARSSFFEMTQSDFDAIEKSHREVRSNPRLARSHARYSGAHTKTKVLLQRLEDNAAKSGPLLERGEPPIKSVVFSGWTSHLDLIQIALAGSNINFVRLDGSMTRTARARVLRSFSQDPQVTCILVSIAAGGLGLNLTAASCVFVMEPQYNPAAEAQAIERVHRLGQKRAVTIDKFIMTNSFEEKMLELQKKKLQLAEMSMERDSQKKFSSQERAKQRMEEIRALFR